MIFCTSYIISLIAIRQIECIIDESRSIFLLINDFKFKCQRKTFNVLYNVLFKYKNL